MDGMSRMKLLGLCRRSFPQNMHAFLARIVLGYESDSL